MRSTSAVIFITLAAGASAAPIRSDPKPSDVHVWSIGARVPTAVSTRQIEEHFINGIGPVRIANTIPIFERQLEEHFINGVGPVNILNKIPIFERRQGLGFDHETFTRPLDPSFFERDSLNGAGMLDTIESGLSKFIKRDTQDIEDLGLALASLVSKRDVVHELD